MKKILLMCLILAAILSIGWFVWFPLVGGVIVITAAMFVPLAIFVVMLCMAILLVFLATGVGIFVLGAGAFVWTLAAIILFPIFFPVMVPIFIVFLFICYFLSRKREIK
ncbi:hypothetical protein BH10PSE19_BH10PSE19_02400 [soil metagenome]